MKESKMHYTEAKLVQLLEKQGIGRPSTFSSLVDKIIKRGYVSKQNVDGKKIKVEDYELENDEISCIESERIFGNEKNKLIIQPLGIQVIEYLMNNFVDLFNYDYTKDMESDLDKIANGTMLYSDLCKNCDDLIIQTINDKDLKKGTKLQIKLDDKHTYLIGRNGPVIKFVEGDNIEFKSIKKDIDIDLEKLKNNEYKLEDLLETQNTRFSRLLGKYKNDDVYLKIGTYGKYIEYGKTRKNMNFIEKEFEDFTIEDALKVIENRISSMSLPQTNVVRQINQDISIRKGKYGDYIFYKTENMTKPVFYKLKGFKDNYKTCDLEKIKLWIFQTYSL